VSRKSSKGQEGEQEVAMTTSQVAVKEKFDLSNKEIHSQLRFYT
jgi:hypothetical protein